MLTSCNPRSANKCLPEPSLAISMGRIPATFSSSVVHFPSLRLNQEVTIANNTNITWACSNVRFYFGLCSTRREPGGTLTLKATFPYVICYTL